MERSANNYSHKNKDSITLKIEETLFSKYLSRFQIKKIMMYKRNNFVMKKMNNETKNHENLKRCDFSRRLQNNI